MSSADSVQKRERKPWQVWRYRFTKNFALTVSRQRAWGTLLKKIVHQIWAPGITNDRGSLLDLHDTWYPF